MNAQQVVQMDTRSGRSGSRLRASGPVSRGGKGRERGSEGKKAIAAHKTTLRP
jgi:hypothetical protein